jgi:hypothetical protein
MKDIFTFLVRNPIVDALFNDDGIAISTEAEIEANAELDPAMLVAQTGLAPDDDLEDKTEEEEEPAEVDKLEVKITVGDCQFGKVTKMKVNPLCLKDDCTFGYQKINNSNVLALRHRRKQRAMRERQLLQTV